MLPRALLYVDAIARAGSVRKAAERLNVAASAVNRQLLDLERELGVELFERLPRGMRATAAGETLLAHIRRQRRDFEATRQQLEALRGLRRGRVRIAAHAMYDDHAQGCVCGGGGLTARGRTFGRTWT